VLLPAVASLGVRNVGGACPLVVGFVSIILCLQGGTRRGRRGLAISGLIGYPILVAGTIAEIFGIHIGLYLTIPGFFFELVLPFWLFFKGFQPQAYQGQPLTRSAA
jgi:hypothetical protein